MPATAKMALAFYYTNALGDFHKELARPYAHRCLKPSIRQDAIAINIDGMKDDNEQV